MHGLSATGEMAMIRLRRLISAAAVLLLFNTAAPAASVDSNPAAGTLTRADRDAIRTVIEEQLEAFRRDDAEAAFGLAAPGIQHTFVTPERFMIMVRRGYRQVYRPSVVEFRELRHVEDVGPVQSVYFEGQDGDAVMALYPMERQPDGSWRINGCHLVESSERRI